MSAVFNGGGVGGRVERQRDALSLAITQMHPPTPLLLPPPLRLLPTVHLAVRRPAAPRHIIKILGCHAYKSQPTSLEMPGGPEGPTPVALASTFPSSGTLKSTARNPEEAPPPRSHRPEGRRERPCYGGGGRECDGNVMRPPG